MDNNKQNSNSTDISNFFEGTHVKLISDPEGFSIYDASKSEKEGTDKILVLGDLLDSTGSLETEESKTDKAYNIRNLRAVVDKQDNIKVLFGNRDLNKIKCRPLIEVENHTIWDGEDLSAIVNKLKEEAKKGWTIPSLKHWIPWWNIYNKEYDDQVKIISHFETKDTNCLERFNHIFGVDPTIGTMSARNLLDTIPMECKELGLISDFDNDDETKAAIVLAVFYLMLEPNTNEGNFNGFPLRGLLTRFYQASNAYYCAYATVNGNLCLFSHGGMTHKFFENDIYNNYETHIKGNLIEYQNNKVSSIIKKFKGKGGFFKNNIDKKIDSINITTNIITFDKNCKQAMHAVLNNGYLDEEKGKLPSKNMLFLLLIGVPRSTNPKWDLNPDQVGPIQPGLRGMRKNGFVCSDKKLIQFIGHLPNGYSSTLDVYQGSGQEQYVINLDISQSVLSNPKIVDKVSKNNYMYLTMGNNMGDNTSNKMDVNIYQNVKLKKHNIKNNTSLKDVNKSKDVFELLKVNGENPIPLLTDGNLPKDVMDKIKEKDNKGIGFHFKFDNKYLFYTAHGFAKSFLVELEVQPPTKTSGGGSRRTKKRRKQQHRNTKRKVLNTSKTKKGKRRHNKSQRRKKSN